MTHGRKSQNIKFGHKNLEIMSSFFSRNMKIMNSMMCIFAISGSKSEVKSPLVLSRAFGARDMHMSLLGEGRAQKNAFLRALV